MSDLAPSGSAARRRIVLLAPTLGAEERAMLAALDAGGFLCLAVEPDDAALARALRWDPDLVLMAGVDPLAERLRWLVLLREQAACPVAVLVAGGNHVDERTLLEAGFDAVWRDLGAGVGPVPLLRSRLEALLRARAPYGSRRGRRLWIGPVEIELETMTASVEGEPLDLGRTQVALLHAFAVAPRRTLSRAQLAAEFSLADQSGAGADAAVSLRRVDTRLSRLRARLQAAGLAQLQIEPVRGYGYRLRIERAAASVLHEYPARGAAPL